MQVSPTNWWCTWCWSSHSRVNPLQLVGTTPFDPLATPKNHQKSAGLIRKQHWTWGFCRRKQHFDSDRSGGLLIWTSRILMGFVWKPGISPMNVLVGGLEHFSFSHILGIIIPIDQYFSEGFKPPTRCPLNIGKSWWSSRSRRLFGPLASWLCMMVINWIGGIISIYSSFLTDSWSFSQICVDAYDHSVPETKEKKARKERKNKKRKKEKERNKKRERQTHI